jgi:hypothetical protein
MVATFMQRARRQLRAYGLAVLAGVSAATLAVAMIVPSMAKPNRVPAFALEPLMDVVAAVLEASLVGLFVYALPFLLSRWLVARLAIALTGRVGWAAAAMVGAVPAVLGGMMLSLVFSAFSAPAEHPFGLHFLMFLAGGAVAGVVYRALGGFAQSHAGSIEPDA